MEDVRVFGDVEVLQSPLSASAVSREMLDRAATTVPRSRLSRRTSYFLCVRILNSRDVLSVQKRRLHSWMTANYPVDSVAPARVLLVECADRYDALSALSFPDIRFGVGAVGVEPVV